MAAATGDTSLHESIGNHAFESLLRSAGTSGALVQRKCACAGSGHECEECRRNAPKVQTKLRIGAAGDVFEQEADRVAAQVVRMGDPAIHEAPSAPLVQRRTDGEGGSTRAPSDFGESLGAGQPMSAGMRAYFEPRFGYDFAGVRLHTDARAADAAHAIDAKAFTLGRSIAFGAGQFSPHSGEGRELLAHELTHVVQQSRSVRRKPREASPAKGLKPYEPVRPTSSAIQDVIAFYKKLPPTIIKQYFIVDRSALTVYDADGHRTASFTVNRPGLVDVTAYYLGNPFFNVGWGWISEGENGTYAVTGLSPEGQREARRDTPGGKTLQLLDQELFVIDWIKDSDIGRFWNMVDSRGLIGMVVMNTPLKPLAGGGDDKPVLRTDYPIWFKELKAKVESAIAEERKTNKADPNLPDRMFFYGSDKVQALRGTDAWTIEVEKGKREAYLTVLKHEWDDAADKDAFATQITNELFKKVKLIVDDTALKKEEQKEITEIDRTGAPKAKGSKFAWAVTLKRQIEGLLATQKLQERDAKDFPDKLTLATAPSGSETLIYLRVWVYSEDASAAPGALPQLKGGTLPVALKPGDKADGWAPIVRKAADALRRGAVTTEPHPGDSDATGGDPTVLPPYPSLVHPMDLNPDRTTADIASNTFRMVIDTAAVHGTNLLNLTTIHMGMSIGYSWKVYPLPEALKSLLTASRSTRGGDAQFLEEAKEYPRAHADALGDPKDTYEPDFDWDQKVSMDSIGVGDYLMVGKASIAYPSDWNMKRAPSLAGVPFTVMSAEDLAKQSAYADSDALAKLKQELAVETDEKKKQQLLDQIKDLEEREGMDLLTLTKKDEDETERLIKKAGALKKFIQDDRQRRLHFAGARDYNPFMFRLKAFDPDLYSLYILVRQAYDYRYDDLYAIDEYTKQITQQLEGLKGVGNRATRLTNNDNLRKDLPQYRSVAALVKEDDGNVVPLILLAGYHVDSDLPNNEYKMMLLDVTVPSPKKDDMTYVGDEESSEEAAVRSAFVEFGDSNKYGNGKVVYRVPQKGYKGEVDSITTVMEYLGYALAVIGVTLLIVGTILSAGALAPASAAAVGAVVTALGISAGVAGAVLAARNIYKRVEKGTFELDAEFALDVISIIGAAVQVVSTAGKIALMSRGLGAAERMLQIERLDRLLVIYDGVEMGGNVILVSLKVHEDVAAVEALHLPKEQEDEMKQQIAMEAVQQGAMLAFAAVGKVGEINSRLKARVEESPYQTFRDRGWLDEHGNPTEEAPPFLREHVVAPGEPPGPAAQGEQAWKESVVLDLAATPTEDQHHKLTVTEKGRIIRCSDFCTDLRLKYGEVLGQDPALEREMTALESRARDAALSGNQGEATKVAADAAVLEGTLQKADDLRKHVFGMTDEEIDAAIDSMEAGDVTGGAKSGYKIDDVKIPKRQRRMIDVVDIMNEGELQDLGKGGYRRALDRVGAVMGKKISDIEELAGHWEAARKEVLGGKQPTDYTREEVIDMYRKAQRRFWRNVRDDPAAVAFLKAHGFDFDGQTGAAMAVLGPRGAKGTTRGSITNLERRISLDHVVEKAQGENWKKALDADNLELMFQNANSWKEIVQVKFGMRESAD